MFRFLIIASMLGLLIGCGGGITGERISSDYDTLLNDGWDDYNLRQYNEAYRMFTNAKKIDEERPEAYIGCGWTLMRRQHPDSAIVVFRTGFDFVTSLRDSVDIICGLAGSYLAYGDNSKAVDLFSKYTVSSFEDAFPLKKHDVFLGTDDLELVQAMAFYRLGLYSSAESEDPDNAVYHVNQVLTTPVIYTDPQSLIQVITDYLKQTKGEYYL
jgi:hypothetical protein